MKTELHWIASGAATLSVIALANAGQASQGPNSASGLSVYDEPRFRGERVFIGGSTPDLKELGFDNRISSVRLVGGVWDLCSEPNFRGRCLRVTGEIVSFAGTGLDNGISSIRRLDDTKPRAR